MAVMIVSVLVVTVVFVIGTFVWWAMMRDWIEKDRRARGRHHGERPGPRGTPPTASPHEDTPRVIPREGPTKS